MRTIIMDIDEMSDSLEVYESKPHIFSVALIYVVAALLATALLWAYFSRMDIVKQGKGMLVEKSGAADTQEETGILNLDSYYVLLYIANEDIGKIRVGQTVKVEITAYPASEYGCMEGVIKQVSDNLRTDESSGQTYYTVKVQPTDWLEETEQVEEIILKPGLNCEGNIVVDQKRVLTYVLEKIVL